MNKKDRIKKEKIKQLEAEINAMQIDHAETFGYVPPQKKSIRIADTVIFSLGAVFLAAGLIWIFANLKMTAGMSVMKIGGVRFFRSVYALPLFIGLTSFFLCEKKRVPLILTAAGFDAAFIALLINMDYSIISAPLAVCVIMIIMTSAGIILLTVSAVRFILRKKSEKKFLKNDIE